MLLVDIKEILKEICTTWTKDHDGSVNTFFPLKRKEYNGTKKSILACDELEEVVSLSEGKSSPDSEKSSAWGLIDELSISLQKNIM